MLWVACQKWIIRSRDFFNGGNVAQKNYILLVEGVWKDLNLDRFNLSTRGD